MRMGVSMCFDEITERTKQYYESKLGAYGATHRGVDWSSYASQLLRFQQLVQICDRSRTFSVNDYGCGYGALVDYMVEQGYSFRYFGFDISDRMVAQARELHSGRMDCEFFANESRLDARDYTISSGIFNVKLGVGDEEWTEYMLSLLHKFADLSKRGFAFNALTKYSDPEFMRVDLYYADPLFFFDYCKRHFSKYVSLVHDYPLYEFTLLVKS